MKLYLIKDVLTGKVGIVPDESPYISCYRTGDVVIYTYSLVRKLYDSKKTSFRCQWDDDSDEKLMAKGGERFLEYVIEDIRSTWDY